MANTRTNRNKSLKFLLVVLLRVKYKIWEGRNFMIIKPFSGFNLIWSMMTAAWSRAVCARQPKSYLHHAPARFMFLAMIINSAFIEINYDKFWKS